MNFYKHHLGDYAAATSHLSWDEDCAYRRLIDQYYKREAPIPGDIKHACRLARANTPAQRKAVEVVLIEFFTKQDDGWHQKRCDVEIEQASAQACTNRLVAEQREMRRRARIVNETLNESFNESATHREPSQTPDSRLQTPDSISQEPEEKKKEVAPPAPIDVDPEVWTDWKAHRRAKKAPVTATVMKAIRREAAKAGISFEEALRMSCQRGWIGFEAAWFSEKRGNGKQAELEQRNKAAGEEWLRRGKPPEREPEIFDAVATERKG
jgi:uncharacterized protein YdaU (DUF1376 family)